MPKYYFFTFDKVIAKTKTGPHQSPVFSSISSSEKIRNLSWLQKFIQDRCQVGDMIFILSENSNLSVPNFYLKRLLGLDYKKYIKYVQYYPADQTPTSIITAIEESFQAVQLDFQRLKHDVVLITVKQDCVDKIIEENGQGILVKRNSDSYMTELEEVVRINNLSPGSQEAETFAMLRQIRRLSPREGESPTSASSSPTEQSHLLNRERSGSQPGSAISRPPPASPESRSGSAVRQPAENPASRSGSAVRRSPTYSATEFSLSVVKTSSELNTASPPYNGGEEFEGDEDTHTKPRRCRWCCC